jgi:hypothetical protein
MDANLHKEQRESKIGVLLAILALYSSMASGHWWPMEELEGLQRGKKEINRGKSAQ